MQTIVDSFAKLQDANMTALQYFILQTFAHEGSKTSSELASTDRGGCGPNFHPRKWTS